MIYLISILISIGNLPSDYKKNASRKSRAKVVEQSGSPADLETGLNWGSTTKKINIKSSQETKKSDKKEDIFKLAKYFIDCLNIFFPYKL